MTTNKIVLILAVAVSLGLLLLVILFILSQKFGQIAVIPLGQRPIELEKAAQKEGEQAQQGAGPRKETLSGGEIAQRMSLFLDKSVLPDGTFNLFYRCDKSISDRCIKQEPLATPHSGMIVLAYLDLYQKTQNQNYKQKADKATQVFLKQCLEENADFCEWNFFVWFNYYQKTKDSRYLDAMLKVADRFVKEGLPLEDHVLQNHGIKLWILDQVTGDKKYGDTLLKYTQAVMAGQLDNHPDNEVMYLADKMAVRKFSLYSIWSNILPAYRLSQDEKYLNFAKDIYDKIALPDHLKEYVDAEDQSDRFAPAMENLLNLADLQNPDDPYLKQAQSVMQKLMDEFMDSGRRKLYDGDFAFLKYVKKVPNAKSTLFNGWMIRLFVKMDKLTFEL